VYLAYPLTFNDLNYEPFYYYGGTIQDLVYRIFILSYFTLQTRRARSLVILMALSGIFSDIMDLFAGHVGSLFLLIESAMFFSMAGFVMFRHEPKTPRTITNERIYDKNILLAFYKGDKGSFIMHLFELFGCPVKSMCIVAGDKALVLRLGKRGFHFSDSIGILKNNDKYIIVDTGKEITVEFLKKMADHHNDNDNKLGFRIRCIEGVSDLLKDIGPEFKPTSILDNIPSNYLKKVA
jgi:hypothetical protein